MKRFVASSAAAVLASVGCAYAQEAQTPPPAESSSDEIEAEAETMDDIVVLASPGDQVRIDRRTYTLRDDAAAQSTNMYDVLGRIPSVSVAPSGAVTLLGADNVTVQLNGQPLPGQNLEQVLRSISGAEVERIEVITNPSAQYSAASSGGIINIITRQRVDSGLSGSLQGGVDTQGSAHASLHMNWSRGPWSLSGGIGSYAGVWTQDFEREREIFSSGDVLRETGESESTYGGLYVSRLTLGYRPTARRRITLTYNGGSNDSDSSLDLIETLNGAPESTQSSDDKSDFRYDFVVFDFQQDGERPREQLRFNTNLSRHTSDQDGDYAVTPVIGVATEALTAFSNESRSLQTRLEYDRPIGEDHFLSAGAHFNAQNEELKSSRATVLGPAVPPDYATRLEGQHQTLAAYATYQFKTGDWTWQPGLRVETYRREVTSGGLDTDDVDTRYFPSIHIRRELREHLNLDLSYTSRIRRPNITQLDPSLRFSDIDRAEVGNPALKPSLTDAYEANLTYQSGGRSFSLTFFDRITTDIPSPFTEVNGDGVIISTTINAGDSEQRGLQAIARGPLSEHWRYSANVNAMEREFDVLSSGVIRRSSEFEYGGSLSLEYRDTDQNAVHADHVQFDLRFQGPRHSLQTVSDEFVTANVTWRRKLANRLYGTLGAYDIFSSSARSSEVTTNDYFERFTYESPGARLRLGLTYQFGSGPQRPPQEDDPPAGPGGPSF